MNLSAWRRLFRIEHALMLCVAVLIGELLSGGLPTLHLLLLSLAVPAFIEMGSFALNDWFDVKTDKENNRKDRPIASGEISPSAAINAAAISYALGISAAAFLPTMAFYLALAFALLSILYNWKLKDLPLIGNAYIAASMAIAFPFGSLVAGQIVPYSILAISAVAFVSGLGREILKSCEDLEGDIKHRNSRTLPAVIGKKNAALFAAVIYSLLIPLSFLPFSLGLHATLLSLSLVALTSLSFAFMAFSAYSDSSKENLKALRAASLLALAVGLLGYAASLLSF
jgi:4-hydroxybenzoate polyprenyltransferase